MLNRLCSISMVIRTAGIFIVAGLFAFCQTGNASKKTEASETAEVQMNQNGAADKNVGEVTNKKTLVVYYFHTNYRCHSCTMIEKLTKQAINTGFADQLKAGRVKFESVNVEEAGNEHFTEEYKLYTKSVILSDRKNGEEQSWKNCEKVWTLLRDEQKFVDYIQSEVKALL